MGTRYFEGGRSPRSLQEIQRQGFIVVRRRSASDQALANRYYFFCSSHNFPWVKIERYGKKSSINMELFGPTLHLDQPGRAAIRALSYRYGADEYSFGPPSLQKVPRCCDEEAAAEMLSIALDVEKRFLFRQGISNQERQADLRPTAYEPDAFGGGVSGAENQN
jgi:hypothetical protein